MAPRRGHGMFRGQKSGGGEEERGLANGFGGVHRKRVGALVQEAHLRPCKRRIVIKMGKRISLNEGNRGKRERTTEKEKKKHSHKHISAFHLLKLTRKSVGASSNAGIL